MGDLNIAASQQDVHKGMSYEHMYDPEEKGLLKGLLESYTDIWRKLHPEKDDQFSVWDERTNKRPFNEAGPVLYVAYITIAWSLTKKGRPASPTHSTELCCLSSSPLTQKKT